MNAHKNDLANGYAEFRGEKFSIWCTIPMDLAPSPDDTDFLMIRNMMECTEDAEYLPKKGTLQRMKMMAGIKP